ncbi:hypothetical protein [Psychrobacter lutiphocae]|uniref:hypothetical protein n=1 Tax=Psychrobacter lutiphocae TaxID=540500 RepID=UPI00036EDFDB|nr:hypothetical protein [Psychrobacter lutiphocae]
MNQLYQLLHRLSKVLIRRLLAPVRIVMLGIAVFMITALPAQAHDELCEQISELAGLVMMARQEGLSAQEMLQVADRVLVGYGEDYHHLVGVMIGDAFRVPRYVDQQVKESEITDFSKQYFIGCQQSYRNQSTNPRIP